MMLADALPEAMVEEIRDITFEEAQAAADEWLRTRYTYVKGHREGLQDGLQEGRQEGRQAGLLAGRLEALADILELRGLIPTPEEQATIVGTDDAELVHRWCARAKHAATVAELFDALDPG